MRKINAIPITVVLFVFTSLSHFSALSQRPSFRTLPAKRTTQKIKIDGLLTDSAWKDAAMMTDLIEFRPKVGAKEDYQNRTETWLMYTDEGIYFGGYCHERTKDSIASELKGRDGYGSNDYIGIIFDTYYDKLNGFEYFITPLNEQWDAKVSPSLGNSEDFTWNAVWQSGAVIHDDGWSFEMFIPYSAIRFGKKEVQSWGLNITRRRRKTEQQYTWNPIDPNTNGFLTQEGLWTDITNIKPPLRLQFSPYFSVYANHYPLNLSDKSNWTGEVNGGLDLKYGLNQAFTLDATLIPDFGQVQSDNRILNLTPFEVKFNENRPFFTEGTELFGKGNLFYSKRIGVYPVLLHSADEVLAPSEKVIKNPQESKLINASKISGRTQKGLGIGVLNAITNSRYATIEDTVTHGTRKVLVDPVTNYNIIVLDQTLKHNSSISLVNTSVWRSGKDYDADVTAVLFDLNDKTNTWNFGGQVATSRLIGFQEDGGTETGYSHTVYFGKTSGRLNFNISQQLTDTKFSSKDFGYFTNNNYINHSAWVGYKWIQPKGWYNRINVNFNASISSLFNKIKPIDQTYQLSNFNMNGQVQTKKLSWIGTVISYNPYQNDFYEPRKEGWFFRKGASALTGVWFESNSSKRYFYYTEAFFRKYYNFYNYSGVNLVLNQGFRFNNKLSVSHSISFQPSNNNIGYTWSDDIEIIFARRDVKTIENILQVKYNFTNKMGINFRARHYLSSVKNKEFFALRNDGKLDPRPSFNQNLDQNVNFFNIDMTYTWEFAPGSFLNIVWKNESHLEKDIVEESYFKNVKNTLESDQNNNLSLKVIYFLDYLNLKKKKRS